MVAIRAVVTEPNDIGIHAAKTDALIPSVSCCERSTVRIEAEAVAIEPVPLAQACQYRASIAHVGLDNDEPIFQSTLTAKLLLIGLAVQYKKVRTDPPPGISLAQITSAIMTAKTPCAHKRSAPSDAKRPERLRYVVIYYGTCSDYLKLDFGTKMRWY